MLETGIVGSKQNILYKLRRIFEEGFEIYGIVLFNCALYREIVIRKISLLISNSESIVKLSEFEQKLGNTRNHNSLIVQHSGSWPEVEKQSNLT